MRILSLVLAINLVTAFHAIPERRAMTLLKVQSDDIQSSAFLNELEADIEKAKDCVEHFGKYSVQEMKELRNGKIEHGRLHAGPSFTPCSHFFY